MDKYAALEQIRQAAFEDEIEKIAIKIPDIMGKLKAGLGVVGKAISGGTKAGIAGVKAGGKATWGGAKTLGGSYKSLYGAASKGVHGDVKGMLEALGKSKAALVTTGLAGAGGTAGLLLHKKKK